MSAEDAARAACLAAVALLEQRGYSAKAEAVPWNKPQDAYDPTDGHLLQPDWEVRLYAPRRRSFQLSHAVAATAQHDVPAAIVREMLGED